jgi:hypothetical protein
VPFATGPQLRYVGLGRYLTVGPTVYVGRDDVLTIPPDTETDLASVPRAFWALLPPSGVYERSAVLHDWLCQRLAAGDSPVNARQTDGLFRRVMRESGVGFVTRWVMWCGVRWGALANPARRSGWWRDSPAVIAISTAVLAAAGAALLAVHQLVGWFLQLL